MGPLIRIALVVVAVAGAAAAAVVLANGGSGPGVEPRRAVSARASFDRVRLGFADRVVARVVVTLDRRRVDASRLKVVQSFTPFTPAGPSRTTRMTRGHTLVVRTETPLACLQEACLSDRNKNARVVAFEPVEARVPVRDGGEATAKANLPSISIQRRVSETEALTRPPPFRTYLASPPVDYRIGPSRLALVLEIAAALLAAAGVAVAAVTALGLGGGRRQRAKQVDELARAIALAREARARPAPDRRKAVGLLARLLGGRPEPLAGSAERLAWSRPIPTPDALSELVTTTEQEVNGR